MPYAPFNNNQEKQMELVIPLIASLLILALTMAVFNLVINKSLEHDGFIMTFFFSLMMIILAGIMILALLGLGASIYNIFIVLTL